MMKLPVFEELKTSDFSTNALLKLLHKVGAGKIPIYIHLSALTQAQAQEQADNVAKALKELGVHPQLPFPCYVITTFLHGHSELPVAKTEKELPKHFNKKAKRLKNKEQSLLNRVRLVSDKLTNEDLVELDQVVTNEMSEHRKLHRLTRETHFLEQLAKTLVK